MHYRILCVLLVTALGWLTLTVGSRADKKSPATPPTGLDWQLPSEKLQMPFSEEQPIVFVTRGQNAAEWDKLTTFWNEATEKVIDPQSGQTIERKMVRIKVPLGLNQPPTVPPENPMTVQKWVLGKQLFFDTALSSDLTVSCASCHDPKTGYTTPTKVSTGIGGQLGGMNGPTVINSAYHALQFWDGRAFSLEDQAQGPVANPLEMFDGNGDAWTKAVLRIRQKDDYSARFKKVFGHEPTRDAIAKAIATYERTVLVGNAIQDRADRAMQQREEEEQTGNRKVLPKDYEQVLKQAFAAKDGPALKALGLDPARDEARIAEVAKSLANGRELFFNKARCSGCHVGDNYSDNQFHNLGVAVDKDGQPLAGHVGRFARVPTGHKAAHLMGAVKTPGLRALLDTHPYMHNGSEKTLEEVIDFYDRGGNATEFLDVKMRDTQAERDYSRTIARGEPWKGPPVRTFGPDQKPIIPFKLNLTPQEKKDLVLFLRGLQSDPVDAMVADPKRFP